MKLLYPFIAAFSLWYLSQTGIAEIVLQGFNVLEGIGQ